VNRRQFLWLAGVAACGGSAPPVRRRPSTRPRSHRVDVPPPNAWSGGDDWSYARATQTAHSPLAVRGDLLVIATADELRFVDARTLARTDGISIRHARYCLLQDGTIAALGDDCALDLIDAQLVPRPLLVPACDATVGRRLVAGASAAELYIADGDFRLDRVRIANGVVARLGTIDLATKVGDAIEQLLGLGDGRVVFPTGRSLVVQQPDKPAITYATPAHAPGHLAAGPVGAIWYSSWSHDRVEQLVLARLGTQLEIVKAVDVAPGRITHMASGETGALAAVITVARGDAWHWELLLLDETGAQRWRVPVPDDIAAKVGYDLDVAFVALTAHRVVLYAERFGLFAWDAATGARIP